MPAVWRLVTARYAASAFSGEGARLYGGRWNSKGTPLIYTAQSQALAMLEMLIQDEPSRARYVVIPAHIPDELLIERVELEQLPAGWRLPEQVERLREIGEHWASRQNSAVLAVPSAVIPAETNYLLNPRHRDFPKILIGKPVPFTTDPRLIAKTRGFGRSGGSYPR